MDGNNWRSTTQGEPNPNSLTSSLSCIIREERMISVVCWVPKGISKSEPVVVEPPSKEEIEEIVKSGFLETRAMCLIDFGMPVAKEEDDLTNGLDTSEFHGSSIGNKLNRKRKDFDQGKTKPNGKANFDFRAFKDPVLFVGHLSENLLLIVERPWIEVVQNFNAPVNMQIFGT